MNLDVFPRFLRVKSSQDRSCSVHNSSCGLAFQLDFTSFSSLKVLSDCKRPPASGASTRCIQGLFGNYKQTASHPIHVQPFKDFLPPFVNTLWTERNVFFYSSYSDNFYWGLNQINCRTTDNILSYRRQYRVYKVPEIEFYPLGSKNHLNRVWNKLFGASCVHRNILTRKEKSRTN